MYPRSNDSNYYLAPPPFDPYTNLPPSASDLLGWSREMVQQSRAYLRLQPAYPFIQDGMDLVNGDYMRNKVQTLSGAKTDLTLRNLRELNASQTNLRIIPAFTTEVPECKQQSNILNKLNMAWQQRTFADRSIRSSWQYATGQGTGYCSIGYDPDFYWPGRGEIVLNAHGPLDVLPLGLPQSHDIQKAYAVAIRVPTPYHTAIRMFPDYADKIKPTREGKLMGHGTVMAQSVKFASAVLKRFGPGTIQQDEAMPWANVDLFYIYIDDDSINTTGSTLHMGDPGTSWEYTVPSLGSLFIEGYDINGHAIYKQATREDARIYPNRRVIISTDSDCLTPDPTRQVNKYWHGKVPVTQFRADDWAWAFLGFPLSRAGMLLERANIELLRGIVDAMNVRLSPPTGYDRNTMARSLAETLNTRIPNLRIGLDYTLGGEQFKPLIPVEYLNTPDNIKDFIMENESRITSQMGVADATALARVRQMPASDSTERLMEALGPIIKDQSRNMEFSITNLGEMWKSLAFQFYTAKRRYEILGQDGLTDEDFDNNPTSMVPDGGYAGTKQGSSYVFQYDPDMLVPKQIPGVKDHLSRFARARQHAQNFSYAVEPYSLHELNSVTRKMAFLQLQRSGFPLSWWTMASVWDIHNFGPKPRDPKTGVEYQTELELWVAQKEIETKIASAAMIAQAQAQANAQVAMQKELAEAGISPGGDVGMGGGATGGGSSLPPQAQELIAAAQGMAKHQGRPPSGQQPPSLDIRPDMSSSIRESPK